jgi:ATP-binding cassette subfamily B (MDR/TAP) protein 1
MIQVFGRLIQGFVIFGKAVSGATQSGAGPAEKEALQQATAEFRLNSSLGTLRLVIIGITSVLLIYAWMLIWTWTGEVNAKRIRAHYLKAILRQDITYFDSIGQGEGKCPHFSIRLLVLYIISAVATRIQSNTHLVHLGIAEKVPQIAVLIGGFVGGFAVAYSVSWKLALAMTVIFPCIAIMGALMNRCVYPPYSLIARRTSTRYIAKLMWAIRLFVVRYRITRLTNGYNRIISRINMALLDHIATGGTLAEEVLSTIRTAKALGAQKALSDLYNVHVGRAHSLELKISVVMGIGMSAPASLSVPRCSCLINFQVP